MPRHFAPLALPSHEIIRLYVEENWSLMALARRCKTSTIRIRKTLEIYDIPVRTMTEALQLSSQQRSVSLNRRRRVVPAWMLIPSEPPDYSAS